MTNLINLNKNQMNSQKFENGTLGFNPDEKEYYLYKDGWIPINIESITDTGINLNLYDLNKQILEQLSALSQEDIENKRKMLKEFLEETNNDYYMLYGKEISYFTLFVKHLLTSEKFEDLVIECLENIGVIKSIEYTEQKDAVEIWITTQENNTTCLYLFPYDNGIVRFKA